MSRIGWSNGTQYEAPEAVLLLIESADIVCGSPIELPFVPFGEAEEDW